MFEQTLLESNNTIASHRGGTAAISFILQALVIAVVVLIPLMFTEALPVKELTTTLVAPPPPPPPPPPPAASSVVKAQPVAKINPTAQLRTPTRIPQKVQIVKDVQQGAPAPPTTVAGVMGGVPGGVAGGTVGGVLGGVLSSTPVHVPEQPKPQRVRVSQGITQGMLTHQVKPEYPPIAKQARIQGPVVLKAIIGKDGKIQNLEVVSGHPMLSQAALQAVKQWRYKPYYLNGQPTEVETTITVNFSLSA
ncbi:MAG TPA: TonB family protein [Terriglobales bacterium]|jgi:periplasmic protein TonB|nr:TonB family protein [Terriglobales bacterium]